MEDSRTPKSASDTPIVGGPYLEDHPGYRPLPGIGKRRIFGDEPAEPGKSPKPDPIADFLGVDREMEEKKDVEGQLDTIQVRVDALLDARLKGLARALKDLESRHEKLRDAVKNIDRAHVEFAKTANPLLARHEAIAKTSYWAVQRLREKGILPASRSAADAAVDAAMGAGSTPSASSSAGGGDY